MQLIIEKQESLGQDRLSKNGITKDVFFVAKNIPFNVMVSSTVNLATNPITCRLFYDFAKESDLKEVETLKCQPMEYVSHVNETGDKATVEIRVNVLSSQHEGALFRLRFSVSDGKKKGCEVFSHPIKIISKRAQVKRMIAKNEVAPTEPIPGPKRATTDQITDALSRLEQQQREQGQLIRMLLSQDHSAPLVKEPASALSCKRRCPEPSIDSESEFELAFRKMMDAYRRLPEEERPNKIRKTLTSSTDLESFNDIVRLCVENGGSSPLIYDHDQVESPSFLEGFAPASASDFSSYATFHSSAPVSSWALMEPPQIMI
eukprot:TRINITY_DN4669_c0_g1_i1.p1 TRINITY_DN4669_c0_g1~~TRINITY_DN4669_c0_g1_i1.p1  ORF type:complete len:318 (+),score=72.63 TRINITY_DN4669_c0_g1_i1:90-1043(+)